MRTLAISLVLLFAAPFAVDSAFADPVADVGSGSAGSADSTTAVAKATSSTSTDWDLVQEYGPIWGGMLLAFGLATRFVRANVTSHWIGEGRSLAIVVAVVGVLGAFLEAHFGGGTWAGVLVTAIAALKLVISPSMKPPAPKPVPPQYGAVDLLIVLMVSMALVSCAPGPGPAPVITSTLIDCAGANRPQIDELLQELVPLVTTGHADWSAIYQRAKHAGASIGGCALAELVQDYLGGRKASPNGDGWKARETLEQFRLDEAGGASFKTRYGEL